jgi:hypothetical protein
MATSAHFTTCSTWQFTSSRLSWQSAMRCSMVQRAWRPHGNRSILSSLACKRSTLSMGLLGAKTQAKLPMLPQQPLPRRPQALQSRGRRTRRRSGGGGSRPRRRPRQRSERRGPIASSGCTRLRRSCGAPRTGRGGRLMRRAWMCGAASPCCRPCLPGGFPAACRAPSAASGGTAQAVAAVLLQRNGWTRRLSLHSYCCLPLVPPGP